MAYIHIPHQRLHNLGLTAAAFRQPAEVVDWLVAVQAQDFAGAKWALGLRMQAATDETVEAAFTAGAILRTHLLRPTWHFVTPADIRWLLALTAPRVQAANGTMYRKLGLDSALLARSSQVLARALDGGRQLTRDELRQALHQAGITDTSEQRLVYMLMNAELEGLICSGARRGKQFTYALLDERAPNGKMPDRDAALAELTRRYFSSRGPASEYDFAKWSGLTVSDARHGLEANAAILQREEVDGRSYWFVPSESGPPAGASGAWLLSIYDEYISSYKDYSLILDPSYAEGLWAMGNALTYIMMIAGQVVGSWQRTLRKRAVLIKTHPLRPLSQEEQLLVAAAAEQYGAFLNLPVSLSHKET